MKVKGVFNPDVVSCRPGDNLGEAARIMWDYDCGLVPAVDPGNHVVGVITDRDICIALATRNRYAGETRVDEVMHVQPHTITPDDDLETALDVLKTRQLRRLPVVDRGGKLIGILSLSDLIRHSRERRLAEPGELTHDDVMHALKVISADQALIRRNVHTPGLAETGAVGA